MSGENVISCTDINTLNLRWFASFFTTLNTFWPGFSITDWDGNFFLWICIFLQILADPSVSPFLNASVCVWLICHTQVGEALWSSTIILCFVFKESFTVWTVFCVPTSHKRLVFVLVVWLHMTLLILQKIISSFPSNEQNDEISVFHFSLHSIFLDLCYWHQL